MKPIEQIAPDTYLLTGAVYGRPLTLPLLVGDEGAMLIDTGCAPHVESLILPALRELGIEPDQLRWIVNTHCDVDHQGGNYGMKQLAPNALLCCGNADRAAVESPAAIIRDRYDAYRDRHAHFYSDEALHGLLTDLGRDQPVDVTFCGGERVRLGKGREVEILHLPGHSWGHLGVLDSRARTLFAGDAIHGSVYLGVDGKPTFCPTYLHVAPYRQTIHFIEHLALETFVGCHWPVMRGEHIGQFCAESRNFVERAERLIIEAIKTSPRGLTLSELCRELGPKLGDWPESANHDLCYAFNGHLEDMESRGLIRESPGERPARFVSGEKLQ